MNIVLTEPLSITKIELEKLSSKLIQNGHEFTYYNNKAQTTEELIKRTKDTEILMIANSKLPKEVIDSCKNLKMVSVAFTGLDHIDLKSLEERNILVVNSKGYSNIAVSELVIGLVLDILRNIKEGDYKTRQGKNLKPFIGSELRSKKVGIIGLGDIGLKTAKLFQGFGCDVIGYNRKKTKSYEENNIKYVDEDTLLKESDIISLHIPFNESTKKYFDDKKMKKMKKGGILINTARGSVVDNMALSKYLKNGDIFAGIDVFDTEPPLELNYPLLKCKNSVLTPHIAYETKESMIKRSNIVFNNVYEYLKI